MSEPPADTPGYSRPKPSQSDERLATLDLDAALKRRGSRFTRLIRPAMVTVPVLLVTCILFLKLLSGGLPSQSTRPGAVATSNPNSLLVLSNVSYGTLSLNGRVISGSLPRVINLSSGDNTITLSAAPFQPRSCVVRGSLPPTNATLTTGPGSECYVRSFSEGATWNYAIDILLGGSALSPEQQRGIWAVIDDALSHLSPPDATVPAGQYFAVGTDARRLPVSQQASQPLTASLTIALADLPPGVYSGGLLAGPECANSLCPGPTHPTPWAPTLAHAPVWLVNVPTALVFRYVTAAGQLVGGVAIPVTLPTTVALIYQGKAGWRYAGAATFDGEAAGRPVDTCVVVHRLLATTLGPEAATIEGPTSQVNGLLGCEIDVITPEGRTARFEWRFGALMAMNSAAQALLPDLPSAPAAEMAAVGG